MKINPGNARGLLVPQGDRPFSFVVYSSEIRDFGFNMAVTDVLDYFDRAEEMAMENVADFFSEQLGEKVTVQDIREGNLSEKIEEASKASRLLAVRRGQLRKAREEMELQKVQKELNELEKKIADLRKGKIKQKVTSCR